MGEYIIEVVAVVVAQRDDESGVAFDREVFGGPAICVNDGCASWEGASCREDSCGEDAVGSCDRDDGGVWIHGDIGADLWGHWSDFVVVEGGADGGGFLEAEGGDGVDESWVDVLSAQVDDLGVFGEGDPWEDFIGAADHADLAFVDGDEGVLNCFARDGVGGSANEDDRITLRRSGRGEVLGSRESCD